MKTCSKCERELPEDMFYKQSRAKDGLQSRCKDCVREHGKEARSKYWKSDKGKATKRRSQKRNYDYNRHRAYEAVSWAIYFGLLVKPPCCPICGSTERIEAHHTNGYDEEHWLDVEFMCQRCHNETHRKEHCDGLSQA